MLTALLKTFRRLLMPWIFFRYTMMTARERKPKSGAFLGGHCDMTRRVARALGPFCLRL
jgi:hypothetical protein